MSKVRGSSGEEIPSVRGQGQAPEAERAAKRIGAPPELLSKAASIASPETPESVLQIYP